MFCKFRKFSTKVLDASLPFISLASDIKVADWTEFKALTKALVEDFQEIKIGSLHLKM